MPLKNILLLALSFIFNQSSFSQTKILEGKILSDSNPVSYASIGIIGKDIGTVADENGHFKIIIEMNKISLNKDTIIVSGLGYTSKSLSVKDLSFDSNSPVIINLEKIDVALNEVVVRPKKIKEKKFGNSWVYTLTSTSIFSNGEDVDDALGRETGMVLKIDSSIKVKDFNFYVTGSQFKSVKFRLQFYDLAGEEPVLIPVSKDILFDVTSSKGWVKVDLVPYNIYIDGKDKIGVTMQWIKSEPLNKKSRYFVVSAGVSLFSKGGLSRLKSGAAWRFPKKYSLSLYLTADSYSE
jgi:hypothetical protein